MEIKDDEVSLVIDWILDLICSLFQDMQKTDGVLLLKDLPCHFSIIKVQEMTCINQIRFYIYLASTKICSRPSQGRQERWENEGDRKKYKLNN